MKTLAGLWIDHREAVIVTLSDKGEETRRVKSHVQKQLRRSGRSPARASFEAQMMPADDSREREYSGHLANYYLVLSIAYSFRTKKGPNKLSVPV